MTKRRAARCERRKGSRKSENDPTRQAGRTKRRKPQLPACRSDWPRGKQPTTARRPCPKCGRLDRAVSSRAQLTYYGPAVCVCGHVRALRKVERPIDWQLLKDTYAVPRDLKIPSC